MAPKPVGKRLAEIVKFRKQMAELGIDPKDPDVARLVEVTNEFVRGRGFTGRVPLKTYGRVAELKLSLQSHVESTIVLKTPKLIEKRG